MFGNKLSIYSLSTKCFSHQDNTLCVVVSVSNTLCTNAIYQNSQNTILDCTYVVFGPMIDEFMTVPNFPPDDNCIVFSPLRPCDPRAAVLLHTAVPEQLGGARESLRRPPAGPGHSPDTSPPQPAPLGCLLGLREAAATGLYSFYTSLLSISITGDEN